MATSLPKMPLTVEQVGLRQIYQSDRLSAFEYHPISCDKIKKVYGELTFESLRADRPYLYASFVTSIDGRIAFQDAPQGPLIARQNRLDPDGAMSDWWILNLLRGAADAIAVGTGTINAESDFTGHIFDQDLEDARLAMGKSAVPWNVVMTLDGTDVPYDHVLFHTPEVPVMICTSHAGAEYVRQHMTSPCRLINADGDWEVQARETAADSQAIPVIVTGKDTPDSAQSMAILKRMGVDTMLVETPGYMHHLLSLGMMDELFLDYSCLYIGGKALTLGQNGRGFSSTAHPHSRVLSIHSHSDSFFYFRHQLVY
ncbi:MAG: dihydrofolate reductase family protein [Eubacteriales bacterium]|nr:dihydrofolate reductase family protein [Eubacteriales bacterium]